MEKERTKIRSAPNLRFVTSTEKHRAFLRNVSKLLMSVFPNNASEFHQSALTFYSLPVM